MEEESKRESEQSQPAAADASPTGSFEELHLKPSVMAAIREMGFQTPTDVQWKTIPPAMAGRDLMVQSQTGSGKTAAFGIPFAQGLVDPAAQEVQALVLAPTRELALQDADECTRVCKGSGLRIAAIYGGAAMGPQVSALRDGAQIVVGTPGRVLDHMRRGNLKCGGIRILVLDECDEMLSMGFHEEISSIIDQLPAQRQTLLFSATIPDEIQRMAERYLHEALDLRLSEDFVGVREIQHIYYLISGSDRSGDLLRVLEYENPDLALIFCNTRDDTAQVAEFLKGRGFKAEGISSDLTQADRERVMGMMRAGELRFLVATDIAARGIDITDISHVINYTFPESADVYVHRTGRTGRAGKSGIAISLVSPREIGSFYYLKLIHKIFPEERHLPSAEEVATRREGERYQRLQAIFADQQVTEEMRNLARRVVASLDGERLLAMALARVLDETKEIYASAPRGPAPARHERTERERPRDRERDRDRDRGGRDRDRDRGERPRRREGAEGGPPRARSSRARLRETDRGERRPRGRHERAEPGPEHAEPSAEAAGERLRERKTTRTRRRREEGQTQDLGGELSGTFLTPDGDIERWEILEPGTAPARIEEPGEGAEATGAGAPAGGARLYMNVGRRQGARSDELGDFVKREASLSGEELLDLRIRDSHTYFSVRPDLAETVIARLSGKSFKDRMLKVERAKK